MKERDTGGGGGGGGGRKMNESEETEEIKAFPSTFPAARIAGLSQL